MRISRWSVIVPRMLEKTPRKIIHVDMDAFYASVEQRDNPKLRGLPVIVGGSAERRGVVASCSYEARRFGVRSAMSTVKALGLCPKAVVVPVNMARYKEASRKIREIFYEVTDLVEPLSLDEAYLDVTENKKNEPYAALLAKWIRAEIKTRVQLTASAGVGPNKFIAKLAGDMRKPDALVVIPPEKVSEFVENLPVEKLWGVGPATAKKLHEINLRTASDIRKFPLLQLEKVLGRYGIFLHGLAHGIDDRIVDTDQTPKSRGAETTFDKDSLEMAVLEATLYELAGEVAESVKRYGLTGSTITLKLRYFDFKTITRSQTIPIGTNDFQKIAETAVQLLREKTDAGKIAVRLLGISLSGFPDTTPSAQLSLDGMV